MMVNSKVVSRNEQEADFPRLMANDVVVVLFNNEKEGMVVHRFANAAVSVGSRMTSGNFDIEDFAIFHGAVELHN